MATTVHGATHSLGGAVGVSEPRTMLLDELMPAWDATRVEWRVINAPSAVVYAAALHADFLEAVRSHRAVRILFAIRTAAERIVIALRRRPTVPPMSTASMRLVDMPTHGDWCLLGTDDANEVAFGAVGRFWAGETKWTAIDADDFAKFDRPGFARIGCNFVVRAVDDERTIITYEARTKATDAASRRAFLRYWRVVSPFVGIVMRSMLNVIRSEAEAAAAPPRPPAPPASPA